MLAILILALCMVTEIAKADFTFGEPTEVPNVNSSSRDLKPSISADGLSLYFTSMRPGGVGGMDIWVARRETTDDPWSEPVNLGLPANSSAWESGSISSDVLSFYFSSTRNRGSNANADLWVTTRDTIDSEWDTPINLGPTVNSSVDQCYTSISSDELELYFSSNRGGGIGRYDLWVTTRTTTDDDWGEPVNLGATVNSSSYEVDPGISADGRVLFFTSDRSGGYGGVTDIWMTTRATVSDPWGEPVNLGPTINSSASEDYPNVSADGSTLFFRYSQSGRYSGGDIWQAPIIPIVDLNNDGIVDAADMCIMIDHWGTDEPLCDIGPMPWGDGIVDAQDMLVLTEYLREEKEDVDADAIYREMCDLYTLAVEMGDLDLYVGVYNNDAVQIPPDAPIRIGSAQVRAAMEPALASFNIICPIYPQEATVNGNWAFGRCDWSLSLTPKEGGATTTFDGRSLDILKRQPDGSWKFYMSCWNYEGPPTVEE